MSEKKKSMPPTETPPMTAAERLALMREGLDLKRKRSYEEREKLDSKQRIREALKRCEKGNFDDLDFLLDIMASANVDSYRDNIVGGFVHDLRGAMGNISTQDIVRRFSDWKRERKAQKGTK